ncbi:MAG: VWA domain-containing protein [Bacteroidales bacterium]|nr:VWA domain-containing protein [Bacteroidales bacterium]
MNIYNVIILDESGSMSSIYKETLLSINEVLSGIRKSQEEFPDQKNFVTIVTFEGNGMKGIKMRRDRVPIETIADFTEADYRPGACTPLYDAMGKTLNELEGLIHEDDRVLATVITDGYENSSEEYSGKTIISLVDRLRSKGWTLAYIGANQDAVEVAKDLHIDNALNFSATGEGVAVMGIKFKKARNKASGMWDVMEKKGFSGALYELFDDKSEKEKNRRID